MLDVLWYNMFILFVIKKFMNKVKFFRLFMVLTIFLWSIPQSGQAVDWFGNSDQEKIKYYEGYNAALAAVTTKALPVPTSAVSVSSTDVTNLQKQINALTTKVNTLEVTTSIDDWGYDELTTSTDNFVTNPMRENLDVNGYTISDYSDSTRTVYVDGNLSLENGEWPWELYAPGVRIQNHAENRNLVGSYAYGDRASAGQFTTTGDNARAGSFYVSGPNSYAVHATASSTNSYAGYFDGPVKMMNGGLAIDHGDIKVDSASGSNGILSTVLVPGGTAIRGVAMATSSLAGAFVGDVNIDGDVLVKGQLQLGNDNIGNSIIRQSNMFWGGPLVVSNTDVGVIVDANNDENVSAFRIMRDGDDFHTAKEVMTVTTDPSGEYNSAEIFKGTFIVNNPQEYLRDTSLNAPPVGVAVAASDFALSGWALDEDSGAGVLGSGFHGVEGRAIRDNGAGIYGTITGAENSWAGWFDGPVKMMNGKLEIEDTSPRVHLKGMTPGIEFASTNAPSNNKNWSFIVHDNNFYGDVVGDHFSGGYHWLEVLRNGLDVDAVNFPLGKVGVGTSNPNKQLHVYSSSTNAEIDIQTGSNTHWGIYQDNNSGNLNFWHGNNKVSFTNQGLSTNGICLGGQCINSWKELKKYLDPKIIPDPDIYPEEVSID